MSDHDYGVDSPVARFDPNTGERLVEQPPAARFDPYTGEPLAPLPLFDSVTGKRLPARSTRWLPRKPGVGFYIGQGVLAAFLLLNLIGMFFLKEKKLFVIIGVIIIGAIGFVVITTISYLYRKLQKLP
jgi:hypothetical protein